MLPPSASCVVLFVFFKQKKKNGAEIHRRMSCVSGENYMSDGAVREWCRKFKDGRVNAYDEDRQGRKSVVTEDLARRVPGSLWSISTDKSDQPGYSPDLATSDFYLFLE
ncbi:hypothetical protein AVEN_41032-1 [Araneus ventricosus]|uniref:Mos1 transposase HTH domain-containing protein n=1 Tax=Araneus ventricosus TaxID=182803 RepID=A0A4Y2CJU5_ARAVE|nr:hypothetical protein AVEN_41032-1 [Araneus ventricosus]